jgi:hypothetical protein
VRSPGLGAALWKQAQCSCPLLPILIDTAGCGWVVGPMLSQLPCGTVCSRVCWQHIGTSFIDVCGPSFSLRPCAAMRSCVQRCIAAGILGVSAFGRPFCRLQPELLRASTPTTMLLPEEPGLRSGLVCFHRWVCLYRLNLCQNFDWFGLHGILMLPEGNVYTEKCCGTRSVAGHGG